MRVYIMQYALHAVGIPPGDGHCRRKCEMRQVSAPPRPALAAQAPVRRTEDEMVKGW